MQKLEDQQQLHGQSVENQERIAKKNFHLKLPIHPVQRDKSRKQKF